MRIVVVGVGPDRSKWRAYWIPPAALRGSGEFRFRVERVDGSPRAVFIAGREWWQTLSAVGGSRNLSHRDLDDTGLSCCGSVRL